MMNKLTREVELLSQMNHENIVRLLTSIHVHAHKLYNTLSLNLHLKSNC